MNRWQRSVDEFQARRRQVAESEGALEALSKVTACFQQQATALGSNSDSSILREEMDETRALAHRICTGLHRRLASLMAEMDPSQEDKEQVDRLWVLFLSALENLQQDLLKASDLIDLFPLSHRRHRWALVNAGGSESLSGVAARAASVQTPWLNMAEEQAADLKTHVARIDTLLKEMLKVSVPFWAVEATQEAWAEADGQEDHQDDMLGDVAEVEVVSQDSEMSGCCAPLNCKLGCMLCLLT